MAEHKRDGPTTCLIFLGIIIDTLAGELRLPAEKLARLQALLHSWGDKKVCPRKELESLIGLLNHACKVVRPGRSFLRRMLDLLHNTHTTPGSSNMIRLNREFRSDLEGVSGCVERRFFSHTTRSSPRGRDDLRRLGSLGVRCMAQEFMVSVTVG